MAKFRLVAILLPALVILTSCSGSIPGSQTQQQTAQENQAVVSSEPLNYDIYAEVLKRYVDEDGFVDYQGLQLDSEQLRAFNQALGEVSSEQFESWSEPDQIAFLINAYNSFTLQSIIDQTPIKASIRDIPGVWRIRRFNVAGQSKTLDDIEHGTLRKDYLEPRIHAALNCTAISCPRLRTEPYTGDRLDTQLDEQVRQWLDSPHGLQIDRDANVVSLSAIFDWFGEDWISAYNTETGFSGNQKQRSALNFISNYVSPDDREYLQQGNYDVNYLEYDWALNIQE
ncbi:DUF547 domain-containing protein [filamentous cyanobacterium CCP1]|nr:DUF547 domain-containing protein [filamentous cyanobacterium CCP2]PSB56844.1 DUF547 domain-containing protein [filamentous cyanobacterium CCP1]